MENKENRKNVDELADETLEAVSGGHDCCSGGIVGTNGSIIINTTSSSADGAMPYDGGYAGKGRNSSHIINDG